jgi:hypothetical protein
VEREECTDPVLEEEKEDDEENCEKECKYHEEKIVVTGNKQSVYQVFRVCQLFTLISDEEQVRDPL